MSIEFKGAGVSVPITSVKMYSDATPMVKTDQWDTIVNQCDTVVLRANSLNDFVVGMFLVDAVTMAGGEITKLVIPYLPGARQDRINPTGDVLFTARSVADMINDRMFEKVITVDAHSPVMPSFIRHHRAYPLENVYRKLWHGYDGVICPDEGAHLRAEKAGTVLGLPVTYGSKKRDVSTGALTGFDITVEPGKHYIVIDDICDGGGTFVGLGEKIREQEAFVDLFVTHGIFSKGTYELKKIYKNIYTTNTRQFNVDNRTQVMVLDVVAEMENYS